MTTEQIIREAIRRIEVEVPGGHDRDVVLDMLARTHRYARMAHLEEVDRLRAQSYRLEGVRRASSNLRAVAKTLDDVADSLVGPDPKQSKHLSLIHI